MNGEDGRALTIRLGQEISSELAEFATKPRAAVQGDDKSLEAERLSPDDELLAEYDRRITIADLRTATRSRFVSKHYADAVEAAVKALNECIRVRTGRTEDGDGLMTLVFSPNAPLLRINKGKSKSDESAQRGHMQLCQGVIGAWRNPRAHTLTSDMPTRCLMMLEVINDLIEITQSAVRTRKPKKP